jgi:hypothetical protein
MKTRPSVDAGATTAPRRLPVGRPVEDVRARATAPGGLRASPPEGAVGILRGTKQSEPTVAAIELRDEITQRRITQRDEDARLRGDQLIEQRLSASVIRKARRHRGHCRSWHQSAVSEWLIDLGDGALLLRVHPALGEEIGQPCLRAGEAERVQIECIQCPSRRPVQVRAARLKAPDFGWNVNRLDQVRGSLAAPEDLWLAVDGESSNELASIGRQPTRVHRAGIHAENEHSRWVPFPLDERPDRRSEGKRARRMPTIHRGPEYLSRAALRHAPLVTF